ncbi:MAG: transporter [Pseudonocardiales bacterium]|nr:transporter [Pseudonocardiales bacterium]
MTGPLLEISNLDVTYGRGKRAFRAVNDVSLTLAAGETLGLVGESGSGKSSIGRAVLGLVQPSAGRIMFRGKDIAHISRSERRKISGDLQVVFQDPRSSLNEAKKVGQILIEPTIANKQLTRAKSIERAEELLTRVGLGASAMDRMPGSFSGGQRQRIAIARALMPGPALVVCDEPVSALDLSVQAQIINLFRKLQAETQVSYLFIAHDLAVVRLLSDRIAVMSSGRIVEQGPAEQVYTQPIDPYTKRLLAAEPHPDPAIQRQRRQIWESLSDQSMSDQSMSHQSTEVPAPVE